MYHATITAQAVDRLQAALDKENRKEKRPLWNLEYHSIHQVDKTVKHFEALVDPDRGGSLRRPLKPDEERWISNERRLSQADFNYWSTRYAFIRNWQEQLVRFTPNIAQQVTLEIWGELERQGRAISLQALKARQLGMSTITELGVTHRVQFYPNVNAVVASSDPQKSELMAQMMERCLDKQPWWMAPKVTAYNKGELIEFGGQDSGVTIQHGTQVSGIARGSTPTVCHLCLSPQTLIRTSNGFLTPIRDIKPGDSIITRDGKSTSVRAAWKSPRHHEITREIWLWGAFAPLSTTLDHRIDTPEGWTPAEQIRRFDFVRHPVRPIAAERRSFTVTQLPRSRPIPGKEKVFDLPLTPEFGYLMGLFLAEGSIQMNPRLTGERGKATALIFSIHQKEIDDVTARIKAALGEDANVRVRRVTESKTAMLMVSGAHIARWVYENFGHTDWKCIPDWVWTAGREFCLQVVHGYLRGDGHFAPGSNEVYASSIRVQLPTQIRDLIASLGFGWSSIQYKQAGVYYERNCRAQWTLIVSSTTGKSLREAIGEPAVESTPARHWRYGADGAIEIQVETIADGFSEEFYDIAVEDSSQSFTTAQCSVHNSELIDFDNPEQLVDASLFRAMHESPWMFLVLESTALGRRNWWKKTWDFSKANYHLGRARLCPVFLPWFIGRDLYPTETWIHTRPVPADWIPEGITQAHAARAEAYVRTNDLLRKFLGEKWEMPREQMWFWELTRQEHKDKGELAQFYSEMPADDNEAFQSTNISVFDADILSIYRENTGKIPQGVFGIVGPGVPFRLQPDKRDIDTNRPPISIDNDYKLIPVRFNGYSATDPQGKLFIWEWPKPNFEHGVGTDTADGIGADSSVMEVLRKGDFVVNDDVQCAEYAANNVNSADLAPLNYALLKFYSVPIAGEIRQAKSVIECARNGENTQHELRKMGWRNFHVWVRYDAKNPNPNHAQRIGWYTNAWSRPMMMDYLIKALRDGIINVNSPWFVDEMSDLDRDIDKQNISAMYGGHDDRVMALGICWFSLHIMELIGPMKSALTRRQRGPDTALVYPRYKPDFQAVEAGPAIWVPPGEEEYVPSNPYEQEAEFPEWAR